MKGYGCLIGVGLIGLALYSFGFMSGRSVSASIKSGCMDTNGIQLSGPSGQESYYPPEETPKPLVKPSFLLSSLKAGDVVILDGKRQKVLNISYAPEQRCWWIDTTAGLNCFDHKGREAGDASRKIRLQPSEKGMSQ